MFSPATSQAFTIHFTLVRHLQRTFGLRVVDDLDPDVRAWKASRETSSRVLRSSCVLLVLITNGCACPLARIDNSIMPNGGANGLARSHDLSLSLDDTKSYQGNLVKTTVVTPGET